MINVTKPFAPPFEAVDKYFKDIWKRAWFTNNGPLVNELELRIKEYLGLDHMLFLSNGTIALQIAIKVLNLQGEIITTPFSYVATTNSIIWEGCTPIFADIDPNSLNIDPAAVEKAITEKTTAILATHVYGNPCDIDKLQQIADKHKLKIIYDAAHCFGTKFKKKSIFSYGDVSTTSFHATKLYHSVEGGGVFTKDPELLRQMSFLRNFGHNGPETFECAGINGKNSELHAAVGLANLNYVDQILAKRKEMYMYYLERLEGLKFKQITIRSNTEFNYAYFPIILESEKKLMKAVEDLNANRIYPRRYFYPSLSTLSYVAKSETPVANDISRRVLCLPLYFDLTKEEADFVCRILLRSQKS